MSSSTTARHGLMVVTGAAAVAAASVWLVDLDRPEPVRRRSAVEVAPAALPTRVPYPPEPLAMQQIRSIDERARRGTILFKFHGTGSPSMPRPRLIPVPERN